MADDPQADVFALSDIYETGLVMHCVCAIVRLGIPELLEEKDLTLSALATSADINKEPLWRVLRFLAAHRIVTLDDGRVALTDMGRLLCKDQPRSMWSAFASVGPADAAHALTYTLQTGKAAVEKALGASFWSYLAAHPREQEIFDALMHRQARDLVSPYIADLEWPSEGTVADIGGGAGTLLASVLKNAPHLHGVLVEQPQVIERARTFLTGLQVLDRCELRQADLFAPAPQADIYLLAFVLHDWSDDDAMRILSALRQGAASSSKLRIFERLITDDGSPQITKMFDIGMLLLTNGRERTADEMDCLLWRTGWKLEEISYEHDPIMMIQAGVFDEYSQ